MLFSGLLFIAGALTIATFAIRQPFGAMLGWPAAIFWAILGGYSYTLSAATWDIYYFCFLASMLGMTIFCVLAQFALNKKDLEGPDDIDEPYFDEEKEPDIRADIERGNPDGGKASRFVNRVRSRAARRRSDGIQKKEDWGKFR